MVRSHWLRFESHDLIMIKAFTQLADTNVGKSCDPGPLSNKQTRSNTTEEQCSE